MSKWIPAIALAALVVSGCSSPYYSARFAPAPLEVRLSAEDKGQARALISVRGIRKARDKEAARIEMAMRLENMGPGTLQLVTDSLQLLSADLAAAFQPGIVIGAPPAAIPPDGDGAYEIHFPVVPGARIEDLDTGGLNLRWTVTFDGQEVTTGITFERVYYDPYGYYAPRTTIGVGVGIHN